MEAGGGASGSPCRAGPVSPSLALGEQHGRAGFLRAASSPAATPGRAGAGAAAAAAAAAAARAAAHRRCGRAAEPSCRRLPSSPWEGLGRGRKEGGGAPESERAASEAAPPGGRRRGALRLPLAAPMPLARAQAQPPGERPCTPTPGAPAPSGRRTSTLHPRRRRARCP